jgi:hypothetical protein
LHLLSNQEKVYLPIVGCIRTKGFGVMSSSIPSQIRGKRLIFTVCTGRCGTQLLADRLARLNGVTALHEPDPNFVDCLADAVRDSGVATRFLLERKLPAIARQTGNIYVETSHVFCKGFLQPLINCGVVPDLILLSRPSREVALSLRRINTVPGRTPLGRQWLLSPDMPGVLSLPNWESMSDYQLCYWYCLEIIRRQKEAADLVARTGGRFSHVSLADIRTYAGVSRMIRELGMPAPGLRERIRWQLSARIRINAKKSFSKETPDESVLDMEESAVLRSIGQQT